MKEERVCVCACDMTDKECVGGGGQSYRLGPGRPLSQLFPDLLQLNQHGLCRAAVFLGEIHKLKDIK